METLIMLLHEQFLFAWEEQNPRSKTYQRLKQFDEDWYTITHIPQRKQEIIDQWSYEKLRRTYRIPNLDQDQEEWKRKRGRILNAYSVFMQQRD